MQRADPVVFPQAKARADDDRFLADARVHAAAHLSLAHEDAEALVEGTNQLQPIEHLEQLLWAEFELGSLYGTHHGYAGNLVIWSFGYLVIDLVILPARRRRCVYQPNDEITR